MTTELLIQKIDEAIKAEERITPGSRYASPERYKALRCLKTAVEAITREMKWREVKYCTADGNDNLGTAIESIKREWEK